MKGNNSYSSLEEYALKSSLNDYANKNEILTNGNGLITTVSNPDNHDVGFRRMGQGQNSFFMMSNNGYMYRCESDGTGHVIFDDGMLPWGNEQLVPFPGNCNWAGFTAMSEPGNCNYIVRSGWCMVTLAGIGLPAGTQGLVYNLPIAKCRVHSTMNDIGWSCNTLMYIDPGSNILVIYPPQKNVAAGYGTIIYPVA